MVILSYMPLKEGCALWGSPGLVTRTCPAWQGTGVHFVPKKAASTLRRRSSHADHDLGMHIEVIAFLVAEESVEIHKPVRA
jgi:hypothetical protein